MEKSIPFIINEWLKLIELYLFIYFFFFEKVNELYMVEYPKNSIGSQSEIVYK